MTDLPSKDDYKGKVEMILFWAKSNEWFDTSFAEIMADKIDRKQELTPGMKKAINRTYSKVLKEHIFAQQQKHPD